MRRGFETAVGGEGVVHAATAASGSQPQSLGAENRLTSSDRAPRRLVRGMEGLHREGQVGPERVVENDHVFLGQLRAPGGTRYSNLTSATYRSGWSPRMSRRDRFHPRISFPKPLHNLALAC